MLQRTRRREHATLPDLLEGDFAAIDFETANSQRASICSVGVALVRDGEVVFDGSVLVNPECDFSPYNQAVNGIGPDDVKDLPPITELWPTLMRILDGATVCAHSATFDIGALRATAARYNLPGPTIDVYCTWRIARRVFTDFPSHGLAVCASQLGLGFDHHEAGDDAVMCAQVAIAAQRSLGVTSLPALADAIGYHPGHLTPTSYEAMNLAGHLSSLEADPDADPSHPLYGKCLCFTGAMYSMPRAEAALAITAAGADFKTAMSAKVDYLVIGDADYVAFADGWRTGKLDKALRLRDDGAPLEIISERDFLALLYS